MLLLILLAGCLASCAAQTTAFPTPNTPNIEPLLLESIQTTPVVSASDSSGNVLAILLTAVQSSHELNETTVGPVLQQLRSLIQAVQPDLDFSLTVKNITRV